MKKAICIIPFIIVIFCLSASALEPFQVGKIGITPITNEISLFKNVDDAGNDRGQTLQIVSINSFNIFTEIIFEFTGDFNFDMSYDYDGSKMSDDHYIELSLVKPVYKLVSINYQRVISTFEAKPVNQFGVRFSF